MSWSLNISPVAKEDFEAAVDAAVATGQPADDIAVAVAIAKDQLKVQAKLVTRPKVGGGANGHVLLEGEGDGYSESLNVNTYGSTG